MSRHSGNQDQHACIHVSTADGFRLFAQGRDRRLWPPADRPSPPSREDEAHEPVGEGRDKEEGADEDREGAGEHHGAGGVGAQRQEDAAFGIATGVATREELQQALRDAEG